MKRCSDEARLGEQLDSSTCPTTSDNRNCTSLRGTLSRKKQHCFEQQLTTDHSMFVLALPPHVAPERSYIPVFTLSEVPHQSLNRRLRISETVPNLQQVRFDIRERTLHGLPRCKRQLRRRGGRGHRRKRRRRRRLLRRTWNSPHSASGRFVHISRCRNHIRLWTV